MAKQEYPLLANRADRLAINKMIKRREKLLNAIERLQQKVTPINNNLQSYATTKGNFTAELEDGRLFNVIMTKEGADTVTLDTKKLATSKPSFWSFLLSKWGKTKKGKSSTLKVTERTNREDRVAA